VTKKEYHTAVNSFSDALYRFALRLSHNESNAQDLVQDTYEKVWIKHEEIAFSKVKSYLFKSLYNRFIDTTRKMKPLAIEEQHEDHPIVTSPNVDLNEILHKALNQLSEIQKSAVLLRDYEGYNYDEIGEILNLTESQVKVYIFRARKHLQQIIGPLDEVI
jgi:RNA polymerase sigma factor (sigma-70 family)